jgi:hypothetical protein
MTYSYNALLVFLPHPTHSVVRQGVWQVVGKRFGWQTCRLVGAQVQEFRHVLHPWAAEYSHWMRPAEVIVLVMAKPSESKTSDIFTELLDVGRVQDRQCTRYESGTRPRVAQCRAPGRHDAGGGH